MMEREFWEQQYPQMPESFQLVVKSAVKKALSGSEREDVPPENHGKAQLMEYQSTAEAVCGIMTENQRTAAEEQQDVPFAKQNVRADPQTDYSSLMETDVLVKAEETPIYSDSVSQEDIGSYEKLETDEPLLDIESVYYDGLTLAFVDAPTEEAQKYVSFESIGTQINGEAGAAGLMYAEGKFDLEEENADKDASTASVLTDFTHTDDVYTASTPFLITLPDQAATELTLTLTTRDPAEADTPNPTVTILGAPMHFSLES